MSISIYIYIYMYICVCIYIYLSIYFCIFMYIHTEICTRVSFWGSVILSSHFCLFVQSCLNVLSGFEFLSGSDDAMEK